MGKIIPKTFLNDIEVCNFLNDAESLGWNLNNFFIKITQGRSDTKTVFFDEDILKNPRRY